MDHRFLVFNAPDADDGRKTGECRCGAWRGAYGLEPTIEMYVSHTVQILREMRRVLRPDGVLFWNVGDSYAAAKGYSGELKPNDLQASNRGSLRGDNVRPPNRNGASGLKPKNLCLIPARVAIAAQQDGWWIRSMIIWAKPNPMPESCTDRPTDAYEHILMLTKSERYFWDADAVREPATGNTHSRGYGNGGPKASERGSYEGWADGALREFRACHIRNVWMFPTQPFSGAHFATFPEEIPRRCILAATSARGACTQCGAPWERLTRTDRSGFPLPHDGQTKNSEQYLDETNQLGPEGYMNETCASSFPRRRTLCLKGRILRSKWLVKRVIREIKTIGWRPTCECRGQHGKTRPCLVLDPFAGSGTTGRAARALRRHAVLADVAYGENDEYRKLALARMRNVDVELPFLD
jgi:DNA modification methylase